MKELKFEELTLEQKIGMLFTPYWTCKNGEENFNWIIDMVKKRALGSVWIQHTTKDAEKVLQKIREVADYPILIFTDAENGMGEYTIGRQGPIGCTDSEEHAYAFGKALGVTARKKGYDVVCNPILDLSRVGCTRSMGSDPERVACLAAAVIRGMHDGGVLSVCKHYPGDSSASEMADTHMMEVDCPETKEDLLERNLIPYLRLNEQGLLDGIMTGHQQFSNIDPEHPTSLSKKILDIIVEQGFNGFFITDALLMNAIRAKYGSKDATGLAIAAGNTFALPYYYTNEQLFNDFVACYEKGIFTGEQLNKAVRKVLAFQKKALQLRNNKALTEEEHTLARSVNKDSIFCKGSAKPLSHDGKHYFVLMVHNDTPLGAKGTVEVDTFSNNWHNPAKICERLKNLYPNCIIKPIYEFPTPAQNGDVIAEIAAWDVDEVVFLTYSEWMANSGGEKITYRVEALIHSLQQKNRASTLVHFGNPKVLEPLAHFDKIIIGGNSAESVDACIDVLAGNLEAKGKLTCEVNLK